MYNVAYVSHPYTADTVSTFDSSKTDYHAVRRHFRIHDNSNNRIAELDLQFSQNLDKVDNLASTFRIWGSIFVSGLIVMQMSAPLPTAELALRFGLLLWILACYRMICASAKPKLAIQSIVLVLAMAAMSAAPDGFASGRQAAIDIATILAGWLAIMMRWHILLRTFRLRSQWAGIELDRHRHRVLSAAKAR